MYVSVTDSSRCSSGMDDDVMSVISDGRFSTVHLRFRCTGLGANIGAFFFFFFFFLFFLLEPLLLLRRSVCEKRELEEEEDVRVCVCAEKGCMIAKVGGGSRGDSEESTTAGGSGGGGRARD